MGHYRLPVCVGRMGARREFDLLMGTFEYDIEPSEEGVYIYWFV